MFPKQCLHLGLFSCINYIALYCNLVPSLSFSSPLSLVGRGLKKVFISGLCVIAGLKNLPGGFNAFFPPVAGGGAQRAPTCAGGALGRSSSAFPRPQKSSVDETLEKSSRVERRRKLTKTRRKSSVNGNQRKATQKLMCTLRPGP